jgi:hypothetical protein
LAQRKPAETKRRLPAKSTGQGAYSQAVRGPDLYPTPHSLVPPLIEVEPLPDLIWEPCAGMGDLARPLMDAGHTVYCSDLIDYGHRRPGIKIKIADFYSFESPPLGAPCIVTNPPFGDGAKFVEHGLKLCPRVIVLQRLAWLEGVRKSTILDRYLARLHVFKERAPMMHRWAQGEDGIWREWEGKRADSAMPFAWFVFESSHDGERNGFQGRRISWRHSNKKLKRGKL